MSNDQRRERRFAAYVQVKPTIRNAKPTGATIHSFGGAMVAKLVLIEQMKDRKPSTHKIGTHPRRDSAGIVLMGDVPAGGAYGLRIELKELWLVPFEVRSGTVLRTL